jgi:protein involved in polysaccharide export with SLBB domain
MISAGNIKPLARVKPFVLCAALTFASGAATLPTGVMAQSAQTPAGTQDPANKQRPRTTDPKTTSKPTSEGMEPDDTSRTPSDVPVETQATRKEQISEENAVASFYNNFFTSYRLGPEDIISVSVFGQERYSRGAITIPPSGRISLALIPGGLFVNGKTTEEVEELIKKKYDEYIIDPQVSVSLDKAASYRYSILGDIAQPGVRLMSHRMTVTEAIAESGGVLATGNKSKVVVLRRQKDGTLGQIAVNVDAIYKGKEADSTYLVPGDQILIPGNRMKSIQKWLSVAQAPLTFARIFGVGGL